MVCTLQDTQLPGCQYSYNTCVLGFNGSPVGNQRGLHFFSQSLVRHAKQSPSSDGLNLTKRALSILDVNNF